MLKCHVLEGVSLKDHKGDQHDLSNADQYICYVEYIGEIYKVFPVNMNKINNMTRCQPVYEIPESPGKDQKKGEMIEER